MNRRVIYLGDTSLAGAASYLAGLMTAWGSDFTYLRSDERFGDRSVDDAGLFVVSDYAAAMIDAPQQRRIVERVADGAGLVMIGGWESYSGWGGTAGGWRGTPIGDALPVAIATGDDRVNCQTPVLAARTQVGASHPILDGLPWESNPPVIGGYNRFTAKAAAKVLLEARHYAAARRGDGFEFAPGAIDPLLVVGSHGSGRTASLACDVAPHWIGPMIDWGDDRVTAKAEGADAIEVGSWYARFLCQLLAWAKSEA